MFEDFVPKLKIGALKPLSVVDNSAYEFYRIAPPGVMLVMIPVGLGKFSKDDVERVFAPLDAYVDQLMERGVDLIMQSGVPLPLLIGVEAHDRLLDRIEKRSGKPATSSVLGVVAAAKRLGLRRIVVANKWSEPMNRTLGEFFARGGSRDRRRRGGGHGAGQFQKISTADHMTLAYELGRAAFTRHPGRRRALYRRRLLAVGAGLPGARARIRPARDLQPELHDLGHAHPARRLEADPGAGPAAGGGLKQAESADLITVQS